MKNQAVHHAWRLVRRTVDTKTAPSRSDRYTGRRYLSCRLVGCLGSKDDAQVGFSGGGRHADWSLGSRSDGSARIRDDGEPPLNETLQSPHYEALGG